jgi:hypothetical protein
MNGIVAIDARAMAYIAATQPDALITACTSGAKIICPTLPPALMTPAPNARCCGASCRAVAPINTEKLPAPAPAAASTPNEAISIHGSVDSVVMTLPAASSRAPASSTSAEPWRSASTPNTDWRRPPT